MLPLLGVAIAATIGFYTLTYAWMVWREEKNPLGALAVAALALAAIALPVYVLYLRG